MTAFIQEQRTVREINRNSRTGIAVLVASALAVILAACSKQGAPNLPPVEPDIARLDGGASSASASAQADAVPVSARNDSGPSGAASAASEARSASDVVADPQR